MSPHSATSRAATSVRDLQNRFMKSSDNMTSPKINFYLKHYNYGSQKKFERKHMPSPDEWKSLIYILLLYSDLKRDNFQ